MTPESKVKKQIKKLLDEANAYYAMPIGTGYGNSGVPDFLCCVNGKFVAIEAKAGKGQATALQLKNLQLINACGGYTLIIREDNSATAQIATAVVVTAFLSPFVVAYINRWQRRRGISPEQEEHYLQSRHPSGG